jgi:hypothetical protein
MNKHDQRFGGEHSWALKTGLFTGACSAIAAAGGVDDLVQTSQRNVAQEIVFFGFSLVGFYIAGCMLWTYRRLQKGLGLTRRGLESLELADHPDRPNWMRHYYIGFGAGATGVWVAWQGGK